MYNTEVQRSRIERYRLQNHTIQNTELQRYRFAVNSYIAKGLQYTQCHRNRVIEYRPPGLQYRFTYTSFS